MKAIIASSDYEISNGVSNQLRSVTGINISVIETIDDFIEALKGDEYDVIISDYSFDGVDIWQLTKLINSKKLAKHALPIYLLSETCGTEIPPILAKEHHFKVTSLNDLTEVLHDAENFGYSRGQRGRLPTSILVIDDDDDALDIVCEALKRDYEIETAQDGEKGLALWKKKRHDLILLDYMLPGRKGDEVLSEIMDIDNNQPIIVMTAFDRPEYNKDFILNGASQYLPKPFKLADLREQCINLICKSKLIYQDYYYEERQRTLRSLVCELESMLEVNDIHKTRLLIEAIKMQLPHNISEDEQSTLLNSGALP